MELRIPSSAAAVLLALALASPAPAQTQSQTEAKPTAKVGVQIRVDSVGKSTKVGDAPAKTSQGFTVTTARLGVTGELAENLTYTLRLNLKSAGGFEASKNTPDGNLAALDRAFIEHRLAPNLSVKVGRMPLWASGSVEADYSSIDQYIYSYISEEFAKVMPVTTGVDLTYTFGTNAVSFDAVNGFYDGTATTKGQQRGENMSYGLAYRGNIAGMVRPIVSYNQLSRIRNGEGAQRDDKTNYSAMCVGAQVSAAGADFDLEYDTLKKPEFTSFEVNPAAATDATAPKVLEVTNAKEDTAGIIAQVAYTITAAKLRVIAKTTSETEKVDGEDSYKAAHSALAVEYRPSVKGIRYHAAMTSAADEAGSDPSTKIKGTPVHRGPRREDVSPSRH